MPQAESGEDVKKELAETEAPRRKRRSPDEIRQRVLDAAAQEFEQFGYSGATTAAIAKRADVTEAQIFRYFNAKSELFNAAVFEPLNRSFAEFNAQMLADGGSESIRDGAPAYIAELQQFMDRHSKTLMTMVVARAYEKAAGAEPRIGEDLREYFDIGAAVMRKRVQGEPRVPPELMVRVSFAAVLGCALFKDWMFPPGLASDEAIRQATIDFVVDGINANNDEG
jgi:AcrR family transcriptional regulator